MSLQLASAPKEELCRPQITSDSSSPSRPSTQQAEEVLGVGGERFLFVIDDEAPAIEL